MAHVLKNFMRNLMLGTDYDEEIDAYDGAPESEEERDEAPEPDVAADLETLRGKKAAGEKSKILNFHTGTQMQVMVTYPKELIEARDLCDYIRDGNICIVNLEGVEKAVSQRIADFIGGAVYAIDGEIERINNSIFVIAPSQVHISGETEEDLDTGNILPWIASAYK